MRDLDPKLKLLEYGRGGAGVCGGHRFVDIGLSKLNDTYSREARLMLATGQEVESEYANTTIVFRLANSYSREHLRSYFRQERLEKRLDAKHTRT